MLPSIVAARRGGTLRLVPKAQRLRFSSRTILVAVGVVAVSLYAFRAFSELREARREYERNLTFNDVGKIGLEEVRRSARALYEVERSTPWLSDRRAAQNYANRLQSLIEQNESREWLSHPPALDALRIQIQLIKEELAAIQPQDQ
jgi:hypothetical protein